MNIKAKRSQGREKPVGPGANTHLHPPTHTHSNSETPASDLGDLPCRLFPLVLVQVGGGEVWGLTTGAKALFCFTAETMLAGEKEKMPEELLQLEGRLVDEAMVGLDGTTEGYNDRGESHPETRRFARDLTWLLCCRLFSSKTLP